MRYFLLLAIIFCTQFGNAQKNERIENKQDVISKQLQDFNIFKETMLAYHAGLYVYNDTLTIQKRLDEMERKMGAKIHTPLEILAFYMKFNASIQCIHSYTAYKQYNLLAKQFIAFNSLLYYCNNELFVTKNYTSKEVTLQKNDQIILLNNEEIKNIKDSLVEYVATDGNNLTYKELSLRNRFFRFYALYRPTTEQVNITYVRGKDTLSASFPLSAIVVELPKTVKKSRNIPFVVSYNQAKNYARIQLPNPLPKTREYKRQLRHVFEKVTKLGITQLVIDLRDNSGGYAQETLLNYLVDTAVLYQTMVFRSFKNAPHKKYFDKRFNVQHLKSYIMNNKQSVRNINPNNLYDGKIIVLINGKTASAASNCAAILKKWSNAVIVGEESGGGYLMCNTGGPMLRLPNSKVIIPIRTVNCYNNVTKCDDHSGVTPDIYVSPLCGFEKSSDAVLDYVIQNLINKTK